MSALAPIAAGDWSATGLSPRRSLRVFGMRRSGNHAIIDWLLRNAGGTGSVFLNNCKPGRNPTEAFATIAVNGARQSARDARRDLPKVCAPAGTRASLVVSYEDLAPTSERKRPVSGQQDAAFNRDLILYRSYLNWCASLLRKLQNNPVWTASKRAAIVLNAIDTYRQMLSLVRTAGDLPIVPICYDDWVGSETYRADRLAALNLQLIDNSLGAVQDYGGGSSFDGQGGDAGELDTQSRFTGMKGDPELHHILALSACDTALLDELETLFPQDAAWLRDTGKGNR